MPPSPLEPLDPEEPLEPDDPLDPEEPLEPDEPLDPEEPLEPDDPLDPLEPLEPDEPPSVVPPSPGAGPVPPAHAAAATAIDALSATIAARDSPWVEYAAFGASDSIAVLQNGQVCSPTLM